MELYRRHPTIPSSLILAGAYAGWAGSLPPEIVEERLKQVLRFSDHPPDRFVRAVLPTMFSTSTPAEIVDAFAANVSNSSPAGLCAMARAFAEADLRVALPHIRVPTLLLFGDQDVRAPLSVAEELHAEIPSSKLVIMPGVGHVSSLEAGEAFNVEVRDFLRAHPV